MQMPGRQFSPETGYRYGFNGKEKDNEVVQYDYGFRIYDPRLGRFKSVDPLQAKYPWLTPYQYSGNSPIANVDLDGLENIYYLYTIAKDGHKGPELDRIVVQKNYPGILNTISDEFSDFYFPRPDAKKYDRYSEYNGAPIVGKTETFVLMTPGGNAVEFSSLRDMTKFDYKAFDRVAAANKLKEVVLVVAAGVVAENIQHSLQNFGVNHAEAILAAEEMTMSERSGVKPQKTEVSSGPNTQTTRALNGNTAAVETNAGGTSSKLPAWNGPVDYSGLKQPQKVGPGMETTTAQRQRILEYNKKMNGGFLRSDIDGTLLDMPKLTPKGGKANMNQAEVDHIQERVNGGSNSNSNLRVISKYQNLKKEKQRRSG